MLRLQGESLRTDINMAMTENMKDAQTNKQT